MSAFPDTATSRRQLTEPGWGASLLAPTSSTDAVLPVRLEQHRHGSALAFLVGVHGGAGVTRLAAQLDHVADGGHVWPGRDDESPYTLLVARESLDGLTALHTVLRAYAAGKCPEHVQVAGMVIVAASPRKPAAVVRQKRELCERVLGVAVVPVYRIGWQEHLLSTELAALPSVGPGAVARRRVSRKDQPAPEVLDLGSSIAATVLSGSY